MDDNRFGYQAAVGVGEEERLPVETEVGEAREEGVAKVVESTEERRVKPEIPDLGPVDLDGDGVISDEELARQRRIEQLLYQRQAAAVEEERSLLKWKSMARPFKERNKEYYTTIGAIVLLLSIILMFAREFLLVAVIMSFAFVAYVLASVKPEEVEHEVTTRGVRTGGRFFRWGVLGRFWFQTRHGQRMVSIETGLNFPGELLLMLGEVAEEKIKDVLRIYLLHETPEPKFVDKAAKWLQDKVPLEN